MPRAKTTDKVDRLCVRAPQVPGGALSLHTGVSTASAHHGRAEWERQLKPLLLLLILQNPSLQPPTPPRSCFRSNPRRFTETEHPKISFLARALPREDFIMHSGPRSCRSTHLLPAPQSRLSLTKTDATSPETLLILFLLRPSLPAGGCDRLHADKQWHQI